MRFFQTPSVLSFGVLLALLVSGVAHAKEPVIITPPLVKPATVSIPPGKPSQVYLHASGRIEEPLTFLIRKQPKHGELGEIQRVDRNTAVVVYTPGDKSLRDDEFAYAAQSADSPVSASAIISVRVVEPPAVLECARDLNFGAVFLGEQSRQTLTLSNTGGATANGSIAVNPPWRCEGPGEYSIPGGSQAKISLVFEPTDERDFLDRVLVGKGGAVSVQVAGTGVAPVSWPRDGWLIRPEERAAGASVVFRNNTPKPMEIAFQWPDLVKAPPTVSVPASGRESVHVSVKAGAGAAFAGDVQASIGRYTFGVPLKIFPAAPRISVAPPEVMALKGSKQHLAEGIFTVANSGGANLRLAFTVPPGMNIAPPASEIVLEEGRRQTFAVSLDLHASPSSSGEVFIEAPDCAPVRLPYRVERGDAPAPATAKPVESFLRIPLAEQPGTGSPARLPAIDKIWLLDNDVHEVSVVWKKSSPEIPAFRVERRVTSAGPLGKIVIKWVPWPETKIERQETSVVARFAHLPENSRWSIRIIPVDGEGHSGPPSPAFQIATKPVAPATVPDWVWLFLPAALAAWIIRRLTKKRRALREQADARIASLESK